MVRRVKFQGVRLRFSAGTAAVCFLCGMLVAEMAVIIALLLPEHAATLMVQLRWRS